MFFIIPILCNSYFKQLISTCSTVSGIWHWSQNPVGYFPIIYRVLFNLLCPFLNLVITVSSLLFHPLFSTVPTLFIITYKCLPFSSWSHLCCHSLITFPHTILFPSDLERQMTASILYTFFSAILAILSTFSFPTILICAGTHINITSSPLFFNLE